MNKKSLISVVAAAAFLLAADSQKISLEWNPSYPAGTAYEVEINRKKLQTLADIDADTSFSVSAEINGKEKKLDVKLFPGQKKDCVALRFDVPTGTTALFCEPVNNEKTLEDSVNTENIFANIFNTENIGKWKLSENISISAIQGGIRLDNKSFGKYTASYTVDVPENSAGHPVKLELDVKNISKMVWPLSVFIQQMDKNGKFLPEQVVQHRWISQMCPVGVHTAYRKSGFIHPEAKKIRITFSLYSSGSKFDNHGLPLKNPDDVTPHLEVTRLVLRSAETLPFPKYNDIFFGTGVTGKKDDTSLVLNNKRNLFIPTRSVAMWGGATVEIRNESEFYFPTGDGTVEAFIYPEWDTNVNKRIVLFDAKSRQIRTPKHFGPHGRRSLFTFCYNPQKQNAEIVIQDADKKFHKAAGKAKITKKAWNHIAVQWSYQKGIQFYVNGKLAFSKKCAIKPINISKEKWPNDCHASQFTIGNITDAARGNTIVPKRIPNYVGKIDALRVSNIARYSENFTPDKQPKADKNTNVLFNFNRSFDGTTLFGIGRIEGSIRSLQSRISPKLQIGNRSIQYIPSEIQPDSDPRVVLNPLNYPRTPSAKEFKTARKQERITLKMMPGENRNVKVDSDVTMDFVEIANNTNKPMIHPFLLKKGEIDPRSFGDLADSLGMAGLTPRDKVNKIFQFLLSASDYFMNHQATFTPGSNEAENVEYKALMMLNGYCGFECGPLNNLAANLFTTAGLCPAAQTSGYGHSFEQVFFEGKNHLYDLSAQKFFTSFDNESAASLHEAELEPGMFLRMRGHDDNFIGSGDHFVRLSNRWNHNAQMPSYQAKVAMTLNPGEKFRVYFSNDGQVNDLQAGRDFSERPYAIDYSKETASFSKHVKRKIYRIDRFFPHYANAFLVFNGKPSLKNPAFKADKGNSFCYMVNSCYPIVYAQYSAKLTDGSFAPIEISTDNGKKFRSLETCKDGVARASYKVRARQAYIIRVKAPIANVINFTGVTEMQVNPRILTACLAKGDNILLFKATKGEKADLTLQYRKTAKEITIDGGCYNGVIPGYERQTALLNPEKPLELVVKGASSSAKAIPGNGVNAVLKNGVLTISAKDGKLPRFEAVVIDDEGAKKELILLVSDKAKIAKAADAVFAKGAKFVKSSDDLIQDVVELQGKGTQMKVKIDKLPAGKYLILTLCRFNSHLRPTGGFRPLQIKHSKGWIDAAGAINNGAEFYKAQYNKPGERAQFKWDYPLQFRYPYMRPVCIELGETDTLQYRINADNAGVSEFAAVIVIPEPDTNFINQMIKVLCGYNHEPWKIAENNKELF